MMRELIYLSLLWIARGDNCIDGKGRVIYKPHITYNSPLGFVYAVITNKLSSSGTTTHCHNASLVYEACQKAHRTGGLYSCRVCRTSRVLCASPSTVK